MSDQGEPPADEVDEPAQRKYLEDLKERGEVVPEGADLPPGATHEADAEDEDAVHRRRFSTY